MAGQCLVRADECLGQVNSNSNRNAYVSDWMTAQELVRRGKVNIGDLVEFDRGLVFKHWAVYAFEGVIIHVQPTSSWLASGQSVKYAGPSVLHASAVATTAAVGYRRGWGAGPTVAAGLAGNASMAAARAASAGASPDACVITSDFIEAAETDRVRVNNSSDDKWPALPIAEIVRRAMSTKKFKYNALTNNCENFANWCRYDEDISEQVEFVIDTVTTVAKAGFGLGVSIATNVGEVGLGLGKCIATNVANVGYELGMWYMRR